MAKKASETTAKKPTTRKKTTAARKPAATKKAASVGSEAENQPCAFATIATTLAEHFRHRQSVPPDCMTMWQAHGRWLANKEGVRFGPR